MKKVYPDDGESVNDQLRQSVNDKAPNGRRHELPDPDTLINHLRLHPALARRKDVSRGAREVFAWIEALALVHTRDDPTTPWLAQAMEDSDRQVARYLAELEDLAVIRVLGMATTGGRIAQHMSPAKDGPGNHDKNGRYAVGNHDGMSRIPTTTMTKMARFQAGTMTKMAGNHAGASESLSSGKSLKSWRLQSLGRMRCAILAFRAGARKSKGSVGGISGGKALSLSTRGSS